MALLAMSWAVQTLALDIASRAHGLNSGNAGSADAQWMRMTRVAMQWKVGPTMSTSMFQVPSAMQVGFSFPESLSDKYKAKRVADFMQAFPRKVMLSLLANPRPSAWFFLGASGLGKTEMALAVANELPAQLHHVASKDCDLERVRKIKLACNYVPHDMFNPERRCQMHVVIIDEADQMSGPAQLAFLSLLDATGFPPATVFIFTGNSTAGLEARFMSRVKLLPFSKEGMASEITKLLASIWESEGGTADNAPNFARIVKDSKNNIRDAIGVVEIELMAL
jgi:replication-associated recombination protein RarA